MLYLIDANVLIRAHEDYYAIDRVPQFWAWLAAQGAAGTIKIPAEIFGEIAVSRGPLRDWICQHEVREQLLLEEEAAAAHLEYVLEHGYGPNLTDVELEKIGQDPFLVAYCVGRSDRCVVTKENRKPTAQRANRKLPDVCDSVRVLWMRDFDLFRVLDFRIAS